MIRGLVLVFLFVASALTAAPWQPFTALAVSPDGTSLATGGWEGEVLCREASTGEITGRWQASSTLPIVAVAFDSAGHLGWVQLDGASASASLESEASVSGLPASLAALARVPQQWLQGGASMSGVRLEGDFGVVVGSSDGRITVQPRSGSAVVWQAHEAAVTGLAWSSNGLLYSCAFDGTLACWEGTLGKLRTRL